MAWTKTIYWVSTALLSLFLYLSAYSYLFSQSTIAGVRELGFPDFFRLQLVVLKIIAASLLLLPFIPLQIKEWAYAGVGLFLLTAMVAHLAHRDSLALLAMLIVLFAILIVSNMYLHKMSTIAVDPINVQH